MNLDQPMEVVTKAAKTVGDTTTTATTKVREYSTSAATTVADGTSVAADRAVAFGTDTAATVSATAKNLLEQTKEFTVTAYGSIKEFPLGDKKVGERAQATVDTVSDKIDVEQIQDQVSKLRHQMESVLSTWKDTFRPADQSAAPAAPATEKPATKTTAKKAPATKASTKTTAKKAPAKKTAAKKAPATKATTKKAPAKKTTTKKTS